MSDILIKNIELKGSLLLTPKAIFKPVEEHDNEKIVQKWEIVKDAEIKTVPDQGDLINRDAVATAMRNYLINHFGERLDEDLSNDIYALIAEAEVVPEKSDGR